MNEIFSTYFEPEASIESTGASLRETLSIIASRYIGQNSPSTFRFRAFHTDSFLSDPKGRIDIDLNKKLPNAVNGQISLVSASFAKDQDEIHTILIGCYSQTTLYFNGELLWQAGTHEEVEVDLITAIDLPCKQGLNTITLLCKKTASGFGCLMGPQMPNWRWLSFLSPFSGRAGQAGFVYSAPVDELPVCPSEIDTLGCESKTGLTWLPKREKACSVGKVFGSAAGKWACGWSLLEQGQPGVQKINVAFSGADYYLDGEKLSVGENFIPAGEHNLLAVSRCPDSGEWSFDFSAEYGDGSELSLGLPGHVGGGAGDWLYLGLFDNEPELRIPTLYGLFGDSEKIYWRTGETNTVVRPYLENLCFGRWNYPLGVTLYGLIQTSRVLGRSEIAAYVERHIKECVALHDYSIWDAKTYGYPEMNNQIVALKSLDDCGSFGSAMLETFSDNTGDDIRAVADRIANHIFNNQDRRENGAFYRKGNNHATLWIDDLYMSIPFLCRYAKLSGDNKYIDDAAKQVLAFKEYLFLPDENIMSHVYDFKHKTDTKVPWGRGNGWCLFSLSELLAVLPEDHKDRPALLSFFSQLCTGYLALQGSRGLWHQVLNRPDAYEETSCTAMFTYAFSRAVRFGWVSDELSAKLLVAAKKAWKGLSTISIDKLGNIYGVCRGSSYSFTPDYYRDVLGWVLNDTHGTGIVMLAGIEMEKMLMAEKANI